MTPEVLADSTKVPPKNIVLCFDGTGDWATKHFTNVMKIYQRLDRQSQAVFYSGGVGTLGSPIALSRWRRLFLKLLDLATATSLRDRVLEGYDFIVREYEEGSRIYLFGFSRGAFTARLVASLIHNFGILEPRNRHLAPYLWESLSELKSIESFKNDAKIIRQQFGRGGEAKVHLMGLFDTVSSVGIFERFQIFPYTDKNPSVSTVIHAVSIDEQRNAFPELLILPDGNHVEEVWFPGVHRDVGGGCTENFGLENDTMKWMLGRLQGSGLLLREASLIPSPRRVHVSTFDWYVFVGLYPQFMFDYMLQDRRSGNLSLWRPWQWFSKRARDPGFRYFWPNFKHRRPIPENGYRHLGKGRICQEASGEMVTADQVRNVAPPHPRPPGNWPGEFVGVTLGVAFGFLIANNALREPFGASWPTPLALWGSIGLFAACLVLLGFRDKLLAHPGLRWIDQGMGILGVLAAAAVGYGVWRQETWTTLLWALGAGVPAALAAMLPPGPRLLAQRAVPLVFFPWLALAGAAWLGGLAWTRWVGASAVSDMVFAEAPKWLAGWAYLSGLGQIVQDRLKLRPVKPLSLR